MKCLRKFWNIDNGDLSCSPVCLEVGKFEMSGSSGGRYTLRLFFVLPNKSDPIVNRGKFTTN